MEPFHPPSVHLPIGLLIGNAVFTVLYLRRGEPSLEMAAFHCLWLGTLLLLPAVVTGTWEAARQLFGPNPRNDALGWINAHAAAGLSLFGVYWRAWQLRRRNPRLLDQADTRRSYLFWLAVGAVLVVVSGWLGGHMVYVLRLGVTE